MIAKSLCAHIGTVKTVKLAQRQECEECVKRGDTWVHLRTCQTCGATLMPRGTRSGAAIRSSPRRSPGSAGSTYVPEPN
jgi:hypothetical protein